MPSKRELNLGGAIPIQGKEAQTDVISADDLCTHGVALGMTGSGKTGLLFVLVEALLGAGVPVILLDIKGDLANLLLAFPDFNPCSVLPWVDAHGLSGTQAIEELARQRAEERERGLKGWKRRRDTWDTDPEAVAEGLSAAVSCLARANQGRSNTSLITRPWTRLASYAS